MGLRKKNGKVIGGSRWALVTAVLAISLTALLCSDYQKRLAKASAETTIAVMTTADLQSSIIPYTVDHDGKRLTVGGLERIASAAKKVRNEVDGALLLSSGDDIIPPLLSVFHGEPEMRGMSLAGYDIVTPGNHEFDSGVEVYKNALNFAAFDVVSTNLIIDDHELAKRIQPSVIKEIVGIKIGVFGMMTPNFPRICSPPGGGVSIDQDIVSAAKKVVNNLTRERCDLIIGLTHLGVRFDRELAQKIDGIDIIIGGHDHDYVHETVGNTIIVQDGARGEYLGVLKFTFEGGEIVNPTWQKILLDSAAGSDTEIHGLMTQYMEDYEERLGQVIGQSTVDLDARKNVVRTSESNLGNLIADSWLDWFTDADVALVNGGSIRGDKVYSAGPITYLTVNEILAFRNEVVTLEMNGADLKRVLEISASALETEGDECPDTCRASPGGFLQVGGLRITIDTTKPAFCAVYSGRNVSKITSPGSRIVRAEIYQNGAWAPLSPSATYTVLINAWTASGGDGHYIFLREDISKDNTTMFTSDILASYIQRHPTISPQVEGRINLTTNAS